MDRSPRRYMLVLVAGAALFLGTACAVSEPAPTVGAEAGFVAGDGSIVVLPVDKRMPAPNFSGTTLDGGIFDLSDARGKVLVLNVWASWCAPCRAEAPAFEAAWQDFAGQGVQFIGLNTRDSPTAAEAFLKRFNVTYPSVIDADGQIQLLFRDTLPPQAIPTTLVIDKKGRVAARALGTVSESSLRGLLEPLLAEQ